MGNVVLILIPLNITGTRKIAFTSTISLNHFACDSLLSSHTPTHTLRQSQTDERPEGRENICSPSFPPSLPSNFLSNLLLLSSPLYFLSSSCLFLSSSFPNNHLSRSLSPFLPLPARERLLRLTRREETGRDERWGKQLVMAMASPH